MIRLSCVIGFLTFKRGCVMSKKRSELEQFLYEMRTDVNNQMQSLMSRTCVIRIIKYFPKRGNQSQQRAVFYGQFGNIVTSKDFNYISVQLLRLSLPKRIIVIEDNEYMKLKDFEFYNFEKKA